jgi:uncharacterized protein (DUF1778 family)
MNELTGLAIQLKTKQHRSVGAIDLAAAVAQQSRTSFYLRELLTD